MTTAKINNQYDYITLRIKFSDGEKLNITRSRGGLSLSGSCASKSALTFIDGWFDTQKKNTIGDTMKRLQAIAERSANMTEFLINVPGVQNATA